MNIEDRFIKATEAALFILIGLIGLVAAYVEITRERGVSTEVIVGQLLLSVGLLAFGFYHLWATS